MKHLLVFALFAITSVLMASPDWDYIEIDDDRQKWGDYSKPEWLRYFGLSTGDLNRDGFPDLVSGRYAYLNPGGDLSGTWNRVDFGFNTDAMLIVDVDGDHLADVISTSLPDVYWLEATDSKATSWRARKVASLKATGHVNGQGYGIADIVSGNRPEILLGAGEGICMLTIPSKPDSQSWNAQTLVPGASDEGFAVGDLDGDGDLDIVCSGYVTSEEGSEPRSLQWWENAAFNKSKGNLHEIHRSSHPIDRIELADLNGDGLLDIAYSEERYPGLEPDAELVVLLSQDSAQGLSWSTHLLATQFSMNNLDLGDVDLDGDIDLVTNEHKGQRLETQFYENDGSGNFQMHVIGTGKEMHLGAQLADLDLDGDLDIFGHAWDNYQYIHLWRNDISKVRITETVDEGMEAYKITTAVATYYYQKDAGGFSSILDKDGVDWIGYRSSEQAAYPESAASDYRGLPNLVYKSEDNGAGHPGFEKCTTLQIDDHTLRTVSKSGKWQWSWSFHQAYAELTVERADPDHSYWFLYEGPIAGRFKPSEQYWGTSDGGPCPNAPDYYKTGGIFGHWKWAYFGDESVNRILLLEHLTPDLLPDCIGFLGDSENGLISNHGMVVFGFGRETDARSKMTSAPNKFRISFMNGSVDSELKHKKLAAALEIPETPSRALK